MKKLILLIGLLLLTGCKVGYQTQSKEVLLQIEKNPSKYRGMLCAFEGTVIQAVESKGMTIFQVLVTDSSYDFDGASLMAIFNGEYTTIANEHSVRVLGHIENSVNGYNVFGGKITMPTIIVIAVCDLTSWQVYWDGTNRGDFDKWVSGELFPPEW